MGGSEERGGRGGLPPEPIKTYDLKQWNDILNNELFGFVQVDIETPEDLKEKNSEMTPIKYWR